MKRLIILPLFGLFLGGCAQLFDANLFQSIDQPPPLSLSALKDSTPADLRAQATDPTFTEQLREDPAALAVVQDVLSEVFASGSSASDAEILDAASTYVLVTAQATAVADVAENLATGLSDLMSAATGGSSPDFGAMFDSVSGGMTATETQAMVDQLLAMADALAAMQDAATAAATFDGDTFNAAIPTEAQGAFAQSAAMAAAVQALTTDLAESHAPPYDMTTDAGRTAASALAVQVLTGSSPYTPTSGGPMDDLLSGLQGDGTGDYAYLGSLPGLGLFAGMAGN